MDLGIQLKNLVPGVMGLGHPIGKFLAGRVIKIAMFQ